MTFGTGCGCFALLLVSQIGKLLPTLASSLLNPTESASEHTEKGLLSHSLPSCLLIYHTAHIFHFTFNTAASVIQAPWQTVPTSALYLCLRNSAVFCCLLGIRTSHVTLGHVPALLQAWKSPPLPPAPKNILRCPGVLLFLL